ncbi:hypothetical protein ACFFOS_04900 [Nocardioides kongjuensis]|uniref:DUF4386 family protein n=1 Tax=Nocardioides kongjuensis TaxID=349522 RepID=A0A852RMQ7_9ACTN|nr:hypothetical protein [Nocardioides kongjuensis]NYD30150.1 hypothetical protein [Nocardioides kongjuensis]
MTHTSPTVSSRSFVSLAVGGLAFIAGGVLHPGDSGTGTKTEQLHEMLVDPSWYPAHALLLLATVGFAAGALALHRDGTGGSGVVSVATRIASVVGVVAVIGMAIHLLEALNADAIADGHANLFAQVQVVNETVIDAAWGLAFAALAVAGGLTRAIGYPVTAALGGVGGGAFALASATIAFTDRFDPLFPVSALLGTWAIWIGVARNRAGVPERAKTSAGR